jgi:hypothetical protein
VSKLEVGLLLHWGPTAQFQRLLSSPDGRLIISSRPANPAISGTNA